MKIIVSVKQVPDTSGKVAVNPDGTLNRASMQTIINPDDMNAVEAALKIKDATGCKVLVVTMGPPPAEGMLRELMARGADRGVLVSGREFGGSDTYATSQILAAGDGGEKGLVFSSGMAAITTSILATVKPGDHIVASPIIYGEAFYYLKYELKRWGVETTFIDFNTQDVADYIRPNTKLVYGETIANPLMSVPDIQHLADVAHANGAKLFIDNTFATPYNTTPLDLGVDAVIHSLTKYIGGHGDLLGGAVISNDEQFLRECRLGTLMHFGSVMAPFTAFLVCRGLKTLGVRMKQYNESALKIAKWLEANPKIETVRYPFLESNPQYAIAKKQMKGGGGMISFDVAGGLEAGKKFINSLKLCTLAVSLGDTETLVEQAAAMTHTMIPKEIREAAGITDGMIRMSVGLEDPDDIIADLKQALGD